MTRPRLTPKQKALLVELYTDLYPNDLSCSTEVLDSDRRTAKALVNKGLVIGDHEVEIQLTTKGILLAQELKHG